MSCFLRRSAASLLILLLTSQAAFARYYLYDVTTDKRRFQTASKMGPEAFLHHKGGRDIIKVLEIADTYEGDNFAEALKKFKLKTNNYKELNPRKIPNKTLYNDPFIWWR